MENEDFDLEKCVKDAEAGVLEAQVALGDYYSFYEMDDDLASKYYEMAAKKGDIPSTLKLANIFRRNDNQDEAIKWFSIGAEKKYLPSMVGLIECLDEEAKINFWIFEAEKVADSETSENIMAFADALRNINFEKSMYWYEESAKKGYHRAAQQIEIINLVKKYKESKDESLLTKILIKIIAMCSELEEKEISIDSDFCSDLGADDLDMFELVYKVEEELDISIPDEETYDDIEEGADYSFKFRKVKEFVSLCKKHIV